MAQISAAIHSSNTLRSAARFVVVGALGTLVDFTLFSLLSLQAGMPALLANTLSYSAGIINNYLFHRYWTYAQGSGSASIRQFSQFAGVSLTALAWNNLLVLVLAPTFSSLLADPASGVLVAKVCVTAAGMGWNFLANHLWTFRKGAD